MRYDIAVSPGSTYDRAARMVERLAGDGLVVDLGCAVGRVAEVFAATGRHYIGVDVDEESLASLRERGHEAHAVDLASGNVVDDLGCAIGERPVAAVLALDVIEHLAEPEVLLQRLAALCERWVDPLVITSIPNVAHVDLAAKLLGGRWDYTELGLLDRTHLSLFTEESMLAAFASHGFVCVETDDVYWDAPDQRFPPGHPYLARGTPVYDLLTWLRSLPDDNGSVYQFVRALRHMPVGTDAEVTENALELSVIVVPRSGRDLAEGLPDTLKCLAAQDEARFDVILPVSFEERAAVGALIDGFAPAVRTRVRLLPSNRSSATAGCDDALDHITAPLVAFVTSGDVLTPEWARSFVEAAAQHPGVVVRARVFEREVQRHDGTTVNLTKATPVGEHRFELWQHLRSNQLPLGSFAIPTALCTHARLRFGEPTSVGPWRFSLLAAMLAGVVDLPVNTCIRQRDESEEDPTDEELVRALDTVPIVFPAGDVVGLRGVHRQMAELAARAEAAERQYQEILTSRTWRVTMPLRRAVGRARAHGRRPV